MKDGLWYMFCRPNVDKLLLSCLNCNVSINMSDASVFLMFSVTEKLLLYPGHSAGTGSTDGVLISTD